MAAAKTAKKTFRPRPPDALTPAALVEFHRVCDALEAESRLPSADPALITLYAQTWAMYQQAVAGVVRDGIVEVYSNGNTAPSPNFRAAKDLGRLIRGLLRDLGLTPDPRGKVEEEDEGMDF